MFGILSCFGESEDRAGEGFGLGLFSSLRAAAMVGARSGLVSSALLVIAFSAVAFAHLRTNHVELGHDDFLTFTTLIYPPTLSACLQIIRAAAFLELFSVRFDGTDALVDCMEEVSALEVDVEPGRLTGEQDYEFGPLPQRGQVQALDHFKEKRIYRQMLQSHDEVCFQIRIGVLF